MTLLEVILSHLIHYDTLKLAVEGTAVPIDVGAADGFYFANTATVGFGAEVTVNTPKELKDELGGGAYALVGAVTAAKIKPYEGKAVVAGTGEEASGKIIAMAVGSGRQAGGSIPVAPDAHFQFQPPRPWHGRFGTPRLQDQRQQVCALSSGRELGHGAY
jgi:diacylglycerol kinase family enzyme